MRLPVGSSHEKAMSPFRIAHPFKRRRIQNNTEIKEQNKSASLEIVAATEQVHGNQSNSLVSASFL